jgi:hypothetical protein
VPAGTGPPVRLWSRPLRACVEGSRTVGCRRRRRQFVPPPRTARGVSRPLGEPALGASPRQPSGHDAPPVRRRVVTNCRPRAPQATVRATSTHRTRRVVTPRQTGTPRGTRTRRLGAERTRHPAGTTPSGHELSAAGPAGDRTRHLGTPHAACRDHSANRHSARHPAPNGRDSPTARRRVVTNCRLQAPQATVRATTAHRTRHAVTSRRASHPCPGHMKAPAPSVQEPSSACVR